MSKAKRFLTLFAALGVFDVTAANADSCPTATDAIATDRPSQTNSSVVVPVGSVQAENGLDLTGAQGTAVLDGTNTRLRFGLAPCLEFLVDLPSYSAAVHGSGTAGFSDVVPEIKWQISPLPGAVDLSAMFGAALPSGRANISGQGAQPSLQFPWSWQLRDGWSLSGMASEFIRPSDPDGSITEATFAINKNVTDTASVFVEYIDDHSQYSGSSQLLNSGGTYRFSPTQQIDFHIALGLNHAAPAYIVGIGYSFRLDGALTKSK